MKAKVVCECVTSPIQIHILPTAFICTNYHNHILFDNRLRFKTLSMQDLTASSS